VPSTRRRGPQRRAFPRSAVLLGVACSECAREDRLTLASDDVRREHALRAATPDGVGAGLAGRHGSKSSAEASDRDPRAVGGDARASAHARRIVSRELGLGTRGARALCRSTCGSRGAAVQCWSIGTVLPMAG